MLNIIPELDILTAEYHTAYDMLSESKKDYANANLPSFSDYLKYLTEHWFRQDMTGTELFEECLDTFIAWYNAIRLDNFGLGSDGYCE